MSSRSYDGHRGVREVRARIPLSYGWTDAKMIREPVMAAEVVNRAAPRSALPLGGGGRDQVCDP